MKVSFLRTVCIVILPDMASQGAWAQNKTQAYYNSHEREIFPDARTAFKNGDYVRTVELCRWHYIIVGDRAADALRDQSERCDQHARRMSALKAEGRNGEVKSAVQALLAINPDDAAAKKLVEEIEAQATPPTRKPAPIEVKDNQFLVKAGATLFLQPFAIAPGAGAGLTFLVGGHFAVEAGLKYYPKVNVSGTTPVSTAGTTYDFPAAVEVLGGGIAPMVSIGWAF